MHVPSFHRLHVFSQSMTFIEHHTLVTIIVALGILVWLGYQLRLSPHDQRILQQSLASDLPTHASSRVRSLSRSDDPQYLYEYTIRAHYINDQIELLRDLRDLTGADRAYVVIYSDGVSQMGSRIEQRIADSFEVGQRGPNALISHFHGFSRTEWLHLKNNEQAIQGITHLLPHSYGVELYDTNGNVLGYLGIEKLWGGSSFLGNEIDVLQDTATHIERYLGQPLESPNGIEKESCLFTSERCSTTFQVVI